MTSEAEQVFSRFRTIVKSYELAAMAKGLSDEILSEYLRSTISYPKLRKLFSTLSYDTDVGEIDFTMLNPWESDVDTEYVIDLLATGIAWRWAEPKYYSELNMIQMFTNKESSFYSQSAHMSALKNLVTDAEIKLDRLIRDRGYAVALVNSE